MAPITTNIPLSRDMVPEATIATAIEVTVELLWINAVVNNPIKSDINGNSAICISSLAAPNPKEDREKIIRSMASKKINIKTHSIGETQDLSQKIGNLIKQPLIIALIGDLGCGKTAFVQGLAKGLEVPDGYYITSPTFTLINEYPGRFPLVHVDLYRLDSIEDLEDVGLDEMLYGQAVIAIEWADKLIGCLPAEQLLVTMEIIDDACRKSTLDATGQDEVNLIIALEKDI